MQKVIYPKYYLYFRKYKSCISAISKQISWISMFFAECQAKITLRKKALFECEKKITFKPARKKYVRHKAEQSLSLFEILGSVTLI